MNDTIWQGLSAVIVLILGVVANELKAWIASKKMNEGVKAALETGATVAMSAVQEVGLVYVQALKEAAADGVLTPEEKKAAKDKAIATAKKNLGDQGRAMIQTHLGLDSYQLEAFLGTKVEAALASLKTANTSAAPAAAAAPQAPVETVPAPAPLPAPAAATPAPVLTAVPALAPTPDATPVAGPATEEGKV